MITGAIVSSNGLTVFSTDGQSRVYPAADWNTAEIASAVFKGLAQNDSQPISIDLEQFRLAGKVARHVSPALKMAESAGTITVEVDGREIDATKLKPQMERIVDKRSGAAFELFMQDFAKIPHKHSAEELLSFLEANEMPIADDGSIIAYKWVDYLETRVDTEFFHDRHSRTVVQREGSLVIMPLDAVDDDRRVSCSTGLHICDYRYGRFANRLLLAKIRASDVISVPVNETAKMRVRAYHNVLAVPQNISEQMGSDTPLRDLAEGRELIARVVSGDHAPILERVYVKAPPSDLKNPEDYRSGAIWVVPEGRPMKSATKKRRASTEAVPMERIMPRRKKGSLVKNVKAEIAKTKRSKTKHESTKAHKPTSAKDVKQVSAKTGTSTADYAAKLKKAQKLYDQGKSLRFIQTELGMCRNSLAKNLVRNR